MRIRIQVLLKKKHKNHAQNFKEVIHKVPTQNFPKN